MKINNNSEPIIAVRKLTKKFGGLTAVDNVDSDICPKEITAIVGSNAAGKSTLIKMISGVYIPTSGDIYFKGKPLPFGDPLAVRNLGIETVYQDLSLAELLNVPDNIFLGREKYNKVLGLRILDRKYMHKESKKFLGNLKIKIPFLNRPIRFLSGGQRQAVSVSRAIYWNAEVIIMDEPTAALGIQEKRKVKDLILELKSKGATVIIISHEIHDVFEISDKIIVLYQGKHVGTETTSETNIDEIAKLIISGTTGKVGGKNLNE